MVPNNVYSLMSMEMRYACFLTSWQVIALDTRESDMVVVWVWDGTDAPPLSKM